MLGDLEDALDGEAIGLSEEDGSAGSTLGVKVETVGATLGTVGLLEGAIDGIVGP